MVAVGGEGLQYPPENSTPDPHLGNQHTPQSANEAWYFIRHGGSVSFAGEDQMDGATTARKILLDVVHLLDEVGKWRWSNIRSCSGQWVTL